MKQGVGHWCLQPAQLWLRPLLGLQLPESSLGVPGTQEIAILTQREPLPLGHGAATSPWDPEMRFRFLVAATLKLEGNHPTGTANLGLGVNSLGSIAAGGASNIAIGNNAGNELTTEDQNVLMGISAGQYIATTGAGVGDNNTLVGHQAGMGGTGTNEATDNTAVGSCSLETIKDGTHNSFLGKRSAFAIEDGNYNSGVGFQAGSGITDGGSNLCLGTSSGQGITTDSYNVCVGSESGDSNSFPLGVISL